MAKSRLLLRPKPASLAKSRLLWPEGSRLTPAKAGFLLARKEPALARRKPALARKPASLRRPLGLRPPSRRPVGLRPSFKEAFRPPSSYKEPFRAPSSFQGTFRCRPTQGASLLAPSYSRCSLLHRPTSFGQKKPAKAGLRRLLPGQERAGLHRLQAGFGRKSRLTPAQGRLWQKEPAYTGQSRLFPCKPALAGRAGLHRPSRLL